MAAVIVVREPVPFEIVRADCLIHVLYPFFANQTLMMMSL